MTRRRPTKAEEAYLSKVAHMGCLVCEMQGYPDTPAEIHHVRDGNGTGQRSNHYRVIPLCPLHHRTGGYGIAFHAGEKRWEKLYGKEVELLEIVKCRLESNSN